jgi:hypothetical protein
MGTSEGSIRTIRGYFLSADERDTVGMRSNSSKWSTEISLRRGPVQLKVAHDGVMHSYAFLAGRLRANAVTSQTCSLPAGQSLQGIQRHVAYLLDLKHQARRAGVTSVTIANPCSFSCYLWTLRAAQRLHGCLRPLSSRRRDKPCSPPRRRQRFGGYPLQLLRPRVLGRNQCWGSRREDIP